MGSQDRTKEDYSQTLKCNGICLIGFWTYLGPVTTFLLISFSFGDRIVCVRPAQEEVATVVSASCSFMAKEEFYPWIDTSSHVLAWLK